MPNNDELAEIGVKINRALFDKDPEKLIAVIVEYMIKNDMKAPASIAQMIPVDGSLN